jgi:DNA-directed RNA polymerase specialized sigma24 family protein
MGCVKKMKSWTIEEDLELIELYQKEYTFKEISEIMGRTKGAVQSRRMALGLPIREPRVTNGTLWSDEEVVMLSRLWHDENMNIREISEKMGRTYHSVEGKLARESIRYHPVHNG